MYAVGCKDVGKSFKLYSSGISIFWGIWWYVSKGCSTPRFPIHWTDKKDERGKEMETQAESWFRGG